MAIRAYLELLRPPNVVTALADVAAGSSMAIGALHVPSGWLLASTACLYAGGVVLNDFFDRDVDATERPERAIPSGRVPSGAAASLGFALLACGVGAAVIVNAAAGAIAAVIAALVLTYDAWAKRTRLGPVVMGLCRAANLLLGIAAIPAFVPRFGLLAVLPFIYILTVTVISRGEVHGGERSSGQFGLAAMTAVVASMLALAVARRQIPALLFVGALAWRVLPPFAAAARSPRPETIRMAVRAGVLSLIFMDAALAATFAGPSQGLIVLALAPAAWALARLFAVT